MTGDDDRDVRQALAVFGAPPIGYRNFRRAPVPVAPPSEPTSRHPAPAPARLTLQWPAQSVLRPPAEPAASARELPALRAIPPSPAPFDGVPHRRVARGPLPAGMPVSHPVARRASATESAAPSRGKLALADMFRALAGSPAAEAKSIALPPMFRRL